MKDCNHKKALQEIIKNPALTGINCYGCLKRIEVKDREDTPINQEKQHKHCWEVDKNWKSACSFCGATSPEKKECNHQWIPGDGDLGFPLECKKCHQSKGEKCDKKFTIISSNNFRYWIRRGSLSGYNKALSQVRKIITKLLESEPNVKEIK